MKTVLLILFTLLPVLVLAGLAWRLYRQGAFTEILRWRRNASRPMQISSLLFLVGTIAYGSDKDFGNETNRMMMAITNRPAFAVGGAAEMMDPNATDEDISLALAKHVPAISSPVGGMPVVFGNSIENHNLNFEDDYRNGWGRGVDSYYQSNWLHSDIKDMAYYHVYKLYDELVSKGDIQ